MLWICEIANRAKIDGHIFLRFRRSCFATHPLPRDFMYFFDLRSPILDAFFFTASVGRPSLLAILAVGLFEKSFLRRLISLFDQKPFKAFFVFFFFAFFFAISCLLSFQPHLMTDKSHCAILTSDAITIKHFLSPQQKNYSIDIKRKNKMLINIPVPHTPRRVSSIDSPK